MCVVSQLPLEDIDEFLFGAEPGTKDTESKQLGVNGSNTEASYAGSLPSKELFKIISIVPDTLVGTDEEEPC